MPTTVDDIKDPLTGLAYCKERMKKCEARAQIAEEKGDLALVAKFEGHLFAWSELAQKYLHSAFQQGQTSDDLLKADGINLKKTRGRNARSKGADDTPEPRAVGDGSDKQGVAVEKHPALAEGDPRFGLSSPDSKMFKAIGQVVYSEREGASQGPDFGEGSDTDSGGTETE